jgi:hypothetical protein
MEILKTKLKDFYTNNKMTVNIAGGVLVILLAWKMFKK